MPTYISANVAVARTRNARQSDGYIGEYTVFPTMMCQIMESISEATLAGKGECIYRLHPYYFHEYTAKSISIGRALMEDKMVALGYRIVQENENLYRFIWLSE
jgi:hypothetical protein